MAQKKKDNKDPRTVLDHFALGAGGDKLHIVVATFEGEHVVLRSYCNSKLDDTGIPWDIKTTAYQVEEMGKEICKKCAKGNEKLMNLLEKELKK